MSCTTHVMFGLSAGWTIGAFVGLLITTGLACWFKRPDAARKEGNDGP